MSLRVCLTGQFRVEVGDIPVATTGVGPLGRLALAYLTTERHRPVPRDELADVLWGEQLPPSWETSVRVLISKLRALLARAGLEPSEALTTVAGCYQLHLPGAACVDLEVATASVTAAGAALDSGDSDQARAAAATAVAIAARSFLPGHTGAWVERQQAELRDIHLHALEILAAATAAGHDWTATIQATEEAIALEPFREQAWRRLMQAHAERGNRGEALRCYERCRHLLVDELGIGPSPATEAAYRDLLVEPEVPAPQNAIAAAQVRVPRKLPLSLTSFVGREDDLAQVASLLASHRLVTLIGTGGVGKTRLALQTARILVEEGGQDLGELRGEEAVLVELAALTDPRLVDVEILDGLGLRPEPDQTTTASLVMALQGRRILLVLDNCEHLLRACAVLAEALLSRCAGLRILATSREPLRIPAERTMRVRSLSAPVVPVGQRLPMNELPFEELLGFESVRLFAERAAAASGLELTAENAAAAAHICAELDGIPLALELAAARTGSLSVQDIAGRLDDRFALLSSGSRSAPSRQRTLAGAVGWTYDTLNPNQRTAFHRLSAFAGGFTLAAAEALWPEALRPEAPETVLDLVTSLVECSVIVAETGQSPTRYRLPETMRQYAAARLNQVDGEIMRRRHLDWVTALAQRADTGLAEDGRQAKWLDSVDAEQDNLRAALGWAVSAAAPSGAALPLAVAVGRFWEVRGHLTEGRRWLEAAIADDDGRNPLLRARALNLAGILAQRQGDMTSARVLYQECLVIRRDRSDRPGVAAALHGLGNLAALAGDAVNAQSFFTECLDLGRELGDTQVIAASLANLGWVALNQGDLSSARLYDEESLALRRQIGDRHGIAMLLGNLGFLAFQEGDFAAARAFNEESLALRRELGDRHGIAMLLGNLGHLAFQEGDDPTARSLYEQGLALRQELGDRHGEAGSLASLGELARVGGDTATASRLLNQAMKLATGLGDRYRTATLLVSLGHLAIVTGDHSRAGEFLAQALPHGGEMLPQTTVADWLEALADLAASEVIPSQALPEGQVGFDSSVRAARLLGAAAALRTTIGAPVLPRHMEAVASTATRVLSDVGPARFAAAWAEGQAFNLAEAVDYAQGSLRPR